MASPPGVVVGIDGGGSKTRAAVMCTQTGQKLGDAESSSSNRNSVGDESALDALRSAIICALQRSGKTTKNIVSICACVSGVDTPIDKGFFTNWLSLWLQGGTSSHKVQLAVYNDSVAALASGTNGNLQGCVLIAGTGTIAYGVGADKREARAAGWGPAFADGGSGTDLGQKALAAVARALDGRGPPTQLTTALMEITHTMASPNALLKWAYADNAWERVADLAPKVLSCSAAGDEVAQAIVTSGIKELADSVRAVAEACGCMEGDFELVLAGGLLENSVYYRDLLKEALQLQAVRPRFLRPKVNGATGAAMLARSLWREQQKFALAESPHHTEPAPCDGQQDHAVHGHAF